MIEIGQFTLIAALVLSLYSLISSVYTIQTDNANLFLSARYSNYAVFLLVALSYLVLTWAFVADQFQVLFVYLHSSTDLPLFYKITGPWGGMEGSLLLWQLILSLYTAIITWQYGYRRQKKLPYILIPLNLVSLFLLAMLSGWSNPFDIQLMVPAEGRGMNPLLQDPGMVIHPPALYLGFVGFTVPFAFAIGSLISGKLDNEWLLAARRWTLVAWLFLTIGMILGGLWAYVELGWGGYWAWDPVENASLMPWLTGTAFLHSVIVQEKRDVLKVWNMVLIITTFTLCILGTFITRSGVLTSVHAFAQSNLGPAFLAFTGIIMFGSLALMLYRLSSLESREHRFTFWSKENSFLVNNVLFLGLTFTVLFGTTFPLLSEGLAGRKISIQAPFFNTISSPIAMGVFFLMAVTPFLAWKKANLNRVGKNLLPASAGSLIVIMLTGWLIGWDVSSLLWSGLLYFSLHLTLQEQIRSISLFQSLMKSLRKDRRRWGGMLVHLGMIALFLGFFGNYMKDESSFSLRPDQKKEFGGYELVFKKVQNFQLRNARQEAAEITVYKQGEFLDTLLPAKAYYPTTPEPTTEVAIYRTLLEDLYITLASVNDDQSVTLTVHRNPFILGIYFSMLFFLAGILLSISYTPAQWRLKKGGVS